MDTPIEKPTSDNRDDWQAYWQQQGQPWRTEPEITAERQAYLDERRAIPPDLQTGTYPFGGIRLNRADIEWLLATHNNGQGPIDPDDETQRDRPGLDLRGIDLSAMEEYSIKPIGLPLAHTRFGLSSVESVAASEVGKTKARANLQGTIPHYANLQGADLFGANAQGADLHDANLQSANLFGANAQNADLFGANLQSANLNGANLQGANLSFANLQNADLFGVNVQGAGLYRANAQHAILHAANVQSANLSEANLQSAILSKSNLLGTDLSYANLHGATLRAARMDARTQLTQTKLDATIFVSDITWGGANLVNLDWSPVPYLADEATAQRRRDADGKLKNRATRLEEYRAAVRAYRLLATALRDQGMSEEADRFAYRAKVCQRAVLRLQGRRGFVPYLGSLFLDLLAGYGYRPARTLVAYLLVILGFTVAYMAFGTINGHAFTLHEGIIFSLTSFHGRGFFPGGLALDDPITTIAAIEAVIGLLIEVSFIATFTQRFFAR